MLKLRVLTAAILVPLCIAIIFFSPPKIFLYITGLITLWAAWEWSSLVTIKKTTHRFIYLFTVYLLMACVLFVHVYIIFSIAFVWWCAAAVLVMIYPRTSEFWGKGIWGRAAVGYLTLVPCWVALNYIHYLPNGNWLLLYLFILIWGADSVAFFTGKKWGKHHLVPAVSPKKSWEGLIGALCSTLVITMIAALLLKIPYQQWALFLGLSIITVLFSIVGDLSESMVKRRAGVKDSGTLLPGHGGLLDRIDSLTAAAPLFALGIIVLG
jgi:phosphatidate cytidylyltransferase